MMLGAVLFTVLLRSYFGSYSLSWKFLKGVLYPRERKTPNKAANKIRLRIRWSY